MKGMYYAGVRQITVGEFDIPKPGPSECVIKVKRAALCGSDLIHYLMDQETWDRMTGKTVGGAPGIIPGTIVGHEASGEIYEVGSAVTGFKPGDRVSVYHHIGCGHCEMCDGGNMMSCVNRKAMGTNFNGTDSEYLCIPARNCMPLPEGLSYDDGTAKAVSDGYEVQSPDPSVTGTAQVTITCEGVQVSYDVLVLPCSVLGDGRDQLSDLQRILLS